MKALTYHGPADLRFEEVPDAQLVDNRDILVKMGQAGICGSDLHIYHGEGFSPELGYSVGHEAIGEVVEVGRDVHRRKVGERVMVSAAVGCGACTRCLEGSVTKCESGGASCYGLGPSLPGCQAEYIRVPAGDFNATAIPEGISDEQALLLTDNLPTAYFGCLRAEIKPGQTVVVVGLGPIGLMAVESAFVLGAARVFAVDLVADRRAIAEELGAIPVDGAGAIETIFAQTNGRLADCVVEAVGSDATISLALSLAGSNGTVSVVGVNQSQDFSFPMGQAFFKSLTFRIGLCPVQNLWPQLVPLVQAGRLHPERVITHRMSLAEGGEAYRLFDARENGALKMVLSP